MERDYAGIVERLFELHLGGQVKFTLTGMRVIEHPFPLFLIRADILCGGKMGKSWNYTGFKLLTKHLLNSAFTLQQVLANSARIAITWEAELPY